MSENVQPPVPTEISIDEWTAADPALKNRRRRYVPWSLVDAPNETQAEIIEKHRRHTAAHWNQTVKLLDGGRGYRDVLELRDRLLERQRVVEQDLGRVHVEMLVHQRVGIVLEAEAERHGTGSPVSDYLDGSEEVGDERWRWVREPDVGWWPQRENPSAVRYRLVDPVIEAEVARFPDLADVRHLTIFARFDWGSELSGYKVTRRSEEQLRVEADRHSVREFALASRLHVIEGVLEEFELLGFVKEMDARDLEEMWTQVDPDLVPFLEAAVAAISVVEKKKSKSFYSVVQEIMKQTGMSREAIQEIAEHGFAAFKPTPGVSGRKKRSVEIRIYETFRDRIMEVAAKAGFLEGGSVK